MLSKWYTKKEIAVSGSCHAVFPRPNAQSFLEQLRYTIMFCGNLISNAFGALIAAGILANMEGVLGHRAWRWLFYIEGAITMFIALIAAVVLPDFPHNSKGFSAEELQVAQLRLREDTGDNDEDAEDQPITLGLKLAFTSPRLYILQVSLICVVLGLSFNAYL